MQDNDDIEKRRCTSCGSLMCLCGLRDETEGIDEYDYPETEESKEATIEDWLK
jgi:hypothetical protein